MFIFYVYSQQPVLSLWTESTTGKTNTKDPIVSVSVRECVCLCSWGRGERSREVGRKTRGTCNHKSFPWRAEYLFKPHLSLMIPKFTLKKNKQTRSCYRPKHSRLPSAAMQCDSIIPRGKSLHTLRPLWLFRLRVTSWTIRHLVLLSLSICVHTFIS